MEYAKKDAKSHEDVIDICEDNCPIFCLGHLPFWRPLPTPSCRINTLSVQRGHEEPKLSDPKSYAAILEKTRSKMPEEFFNNAVGKDCMTEETLDEAWPALRYPEKGWNIIPPKAWGPKCEAPLHRTFGSL